MFDVEKLTPDRIMVRDHRDGHLWVFAVDEALDHSRGLAVSAVVKCPTASRSPYERAAEAQRYAEHEALKRGLIDG